MGVIGGWVTRVREGPPTHAVGRPWAFTNGHDARLCALVAGGPDAYFPLGEGLLGTGLAGFPVPTSVALARQAESRDMCAGRVS